MVQDLVKPGIKVAAQNCSATGNGAFTGEVNAAQVKDAGLVGAPRALRAPQALRRDGG